MADAVREIGCEPRRLGIVVDDIGSTSKTLPQFTKLWEQMLA